MESTSDEKNNVHPISEYARLSAGLFTMPAETIAESLASREVSPQGPSAGLRLLTFYMNYAGKRLSPSRRRNLEKAKKLLEGRVTRDLIQREREHQRKIA